MALESLQLLNFRNFKSLSLKLGEKVNIFYGPNAQGKTNLLEAISLVATLKSFRASLDSEMITWDEKEARVFAKLGSVTIEILFKEGSKKVLVNNISKNLIEAWGTLKVVSFVPQEVYLLTSSPDRRRKYLDALISFTDRKYLKNVIEYYKVVRNRNKILFFIQEGRSSQAALEVWNETLVDLATQVWFKRKETIEKLNELLEKKARGVFVDGEVRIEYKPKLLLKDLTKEQLKEKFHRALKDIYNTEVERSTTLLGPHRDDFFLILRNLTTPSKEKDLNTYGSRGEQKAAVLTLKVAEMELLSMLTNERPSLLLDEVLAELDINKQKFLLELVSDQQTFISATSLDLFPQEFVKKAKIFRVEEGEISQE